METPREVLFALAKLFCRFSDFLPSHCRRSDRESERAARDAFRTFRLCVSLHCARSPFRQPVRPARSRLNALAFHLITLARCPLLHCCFRKGSVFISRCIHQRIINSSLVMLRHRTLGSVFTSIKWLCDNIKIKFEQFFYAGKRKKLNILLKNNTGLLNNIIKSKDVFIYIYNIIIN